MSRKILALTFDDGPNPEITLPVLDLLREYNAAASFFLVGGRITPETEPILRRAVAQGCELCAHSFSHRDMTQLSAEEIRTEMLETEWRMISAAGVTPRFFRPPYIAVSDAMFDLIPLPFIEGYGVRDYDAAVTAEERITGVLQKAKDGGIILLHDSGENVQTVEALKRILPALRSEGYDFVTVSQLFAGKRITPVPHARILYSYPEQTELYAPDL